MPVYSLWTAAHPGLIELGGQQVKRPQDYQPKRGQKRKARRR